MIFRPTPNWISDKFDWSVVVEFEVGALLPPRFVSSMFHSVSMEQTAKTHPGWSGLNCRPNQSQSCPRASNWSIDGALLVDVWLMLLNGQARH